MTKAIKNNGVQTLYINHLALNIETLSAISIDCFNDNSTQLYKGIGSAPFTVNIKLAWLSFNQPTLPVHAAVIKTETGGITELGLRVVAAKWQ